LGHLTVGEPQDVSPPLLWN